MVRLGTTSREHPARATRLAASLAVCVLAALVLAAVLVPAAAPASPSLGDLRAQAREVRGEVARLDHRAGVLTEEYNTARVRLDDLNVRLQETRRDLERARLDLDTAQALRSKRLVAMYKGGGYDLLDVLFTLDDFAEAGTQLDYFRAIDEADRDTVARIAQAEQSILRLTQRLDEDRAEALDREMDLRDQQAAIEDELAARRRLLSALDARVKKLLAEQARRAREAAARLARAAGVDLATIRGTPAQVAVIRETMKYLRIPYVWGGASPSGGFDCSGLVLYVYAKFGVAFPHGATMQAHMGDAVPLSKAEPADLVFFGSPAFYHHVGIYVGNGLFIEAPHTGDVVKVSELAGRGCSLVCRYPISLP